MDEIIDTRSEKEIEEEDNWEKEYHKFMYDYYEQFFIKVENNSDKLMCWNPLTNKEIVCDNNDIEEFAKLVEQFSNNTDVYIHLGAQWIEKYEYNTLNTKGTCYCRTPECWGIYPPKGISGYMPKETLIELYFLTIKPTIVSFFPKLLDSDIKLTFFDEIDGGSLYGTKDGFNDVMSGIVTKTLHFSESIVIF
jgi:hypothetical protein